MARTRKKPGAAASPPAAGSETELTRPSAGSRGQPSDRPRIGWLNPLQQEELRAFISYRTAKLEQRKYQMLLVKEFLDDPSRFGLSGGDIPTSTSLAEFAERRNDLEHRIAIAKTFLDLLNEELRQLDQAEAWVKKERRKRKQPKARSEATRE